MFYNPCFSGFPVVQDSRDRDSSLRGVLDRLPTALENSVSDIASSIPIGGDLDEGFKRDVEDSVREIVSMLAGGGYLIPSDGSRPVLAPSDKLVYLVSLARVIWIIKDAIHRGDVLANYARELIDSSLRPEVVKPVVAFVITFISLHEVYKTGIRGIDPRKAIPQFTVSHRPDGGIEGVKLRDPGSGETIEMDRAFVVALDAVSGYIARGMLGSRELNTQYRRVLDSAVEILSDEENSRNRWILEAILYRLSIDAVKIVLESMTS